MADTYPTLDFTAHGQRDAEWTGPGGTRYRFMDRASGTGFWRWDESGRGRWMFDGVMVFGGPFTRVPVLDELGVDADFNEDWGYGCDDSDCDCGGDC